MSDGGEKTCPLCADEMDLTDQQLKPCKCGYEICIWCFHQIIDMAEKDETAGRCPACRMPYNKEKIVGTEVNCGRLVSEVNVEKKFKLQKGKSKSVEGRKQLGSVRVIQRNLVYVVGLPLDFADEDLLQEREYFSQYGKVLKVSISRTSAGAIQQIANSACSVYITYSKEEEAIRCIQSVHGFVLDGRPLKACFGTTKYCHAWLRNVPCSNPDCLYLHEVGSEEASFTKDSTISAYTRNTVQHITGSSNNIQRRSGNVLPAPEDAYCNNSSASSEKPLPKSATNTNNSLISARVSPPGSSSGRSAALPAGAAWGNRPSNSQPLPINTSSSNGPLKQKPDPSNIPVVLSTAVASQSQKSVVPNEEATLSHDKIKTETVKPIKEESNRDRRIAVSESSFPSVQIPALPINRQPHLQPLTEPPSNSIHKVNSSFTSNKPASEKDSLDTREGNMENICSKILSMSTHEKQQLQNGHIEHTSEPLTLQKSIKAANTAKEVPVKGVQSDFRLGVLTEVKPVTLHDIEDDLLSFDNQRIKDPEIGTDRISDFSRTFHMSQQPFPSSSFNNASSLNNLNLDRHAVDRNNNSIVSISNFPSAHPANMFNSPMVNGGEYSNPFPSKGSLDVGESSIISNILSMDFDPWNESLTSPQNLAKLLGEANKQGSFGVPGPRKTQNNNQSRFSFAREQEPISKLSNYGHSVDHVQQSPMQQFGHDFLNGTNLHPEKFISRNGFSVPNGTESDIFAGNHSRISSIKNSGSRSQISAPPGFSVPSRAAPPGFTTHERAEQIFDAHSANNMLDASSFLRNQYQTPSASSGNTYSNDDIEFIDPAILEVGKGIFAGGVNNPGLLDIRSSYNNTPQSNAYEEARFQSLLQRSLPQHQSQRFAHNNGDMFSPPNNGYGIHSRVMEHHALANNPSPYSQFNVPQSRNGITSNGQWDGWNEIQGGNNMGISELLRSDRLGYNKFGGYEDSKLRMPGSGNLYNGSYGI